MHGGFGGAPKFPPIMVLLFLLRHYQRTGDADALEMVRATAEAMARGGIYDQLAGGFARYSVDERWLVPHFEKMLYDNALLLRVYTDALAADRRPAGGPGRVGDRLGSWSTSCATPDGGFASSLDADTDGVEGATYAWTPAQLERRSGDEDGPWAADLLGVTEAGTFEHGTSVLRLARDVDDARGGARRWPDVRGRLLAAREAPARSRAATTRSSPPGTAWRPPARARRRRRDSRDRARTVGSPGRGAPAAGRHESAAADSDIRDMDGASGGVARSARRPDGQHPRHHDAAQNLRRPRSDLPGRVDVLRHRRARARPRYLQRAIGRRYFAASTLRGALQFDPLRDVTAFQALLASAEAGRQRALTAFRDTAGERLLAL